MGSAPLFTIALAALTLSAFAYRSARLAQRTSRPESVPSLRLRVLEAQARRSVADDQRDYAFLTELFNETAAAVTITTITLRVTYRTRANFLGAVDLEVEPAAVVAAGSRPLLALPAHVKSGETTSGWILFSTVNVIPRHCRIQDYALVGRDAHGSRILVDASLPALLAADTDGQGPATWGWD